MEKLVTTEFLKLNEVYQNTTSGYPYDVIPGWSFIIIIVGFIAMVMFGIIFLIAFKIIFDKFSAKFKNESQPQTESLLLERHKAHEHELKSVEIHKAEEKEKAKEMSVEEKMKLDKPKEMSVEEKMEQEKKSESAPKMEEVKL